MPAYAAEGQQAGPVSWETTAPPSQGRQAEPDARETAAQPAELRQAGPAAWETATSPTDAPPAGVAEAAADGGAPARKLVGWLPMALGVLGLTLGTLWTLQGLDMIDGSRMSGVAIWSVIGPVVAVAGLAAVVVGVKMRTRSKRRTA